MRSPYVSISRRSLVALFVMVAIVALGAGFLAGVPSEVPPAHAAACKSANAVCGGGDTSKTSAMYVNHHTDPGYGGTSTVVEPDDGESWQITAYWNEAGMVPCNEISEVAYVDVSWNGSSWVTSNVTTTAHIVNISVCQGSTCDAGGGSTHAWDYKLIVDITDPAASTYHLRSVQYTTTSVDDGYTIEDPTQTQGYCYTNASVSPTSQSNTAYDTPVTWPIGRCGFNCTITGGNITILYD